MTQVHTHSYNSPAYERGSDPNFWKDFQPANAFSRQYWPHERRSWEPCSPMSEPKYVPFDGPPKAGNHSSKGPDMTQNPSREKLPPLSSLFGSPSSHQSRPTQSPYLDRHKPMFPAVTPLDARYSTTPSHLERPYDNSYFQRLGATRQDGYTTTSDPVERLGFPAAPRSTYSSVRPESPRYESHYASTETPRSHNTGWSPRSAFSAPEMFPRDTSSSFRPVTATRSHPPQNRKHGQDSWPVNHESAPDASAPLPQPPTSTSTAPGESLTGKDGLGPKIWTGTQFLPRFVRQAEVPGEGMCYFYDDGTHCKIAIDGEIVNAHWGVTKAGKPRKRLAIACITCREKKIKCDPDYPRCVQCEKFGRICKFKNAPRGSQGSPDTPPADSEDLAPRPGSSRTDNESTRVERRENSQSVSPRQTLRRPTPESDNHPSKRQRTGYTAFTPVASESSPRISLLDITPPSNIRLETGNSLIDHSALRVWQINPYTSNPDLVTELLAVFFNRAPETTRGMFPEALFTSWVLSVGEKSLDDLMLIYTILAHGSVFSSKPEHKVVGVQYASISRYACGNRHFSIQLVQARLVLAFYYFAVNNPNDSWDALGGATRAASGLRFNVEFEKSEDAYLKTFPYGLNRHGYAESRRRTFWSCYLMDRFNGSCSGHFSFVQAEDVFLRLPCDRESFELQREVQNPYFDASVPVIKNINRTIGSTAHLINICSIWGDVSTNIYRSKHRPAQTMSNSSFPKFYDTITERLRAWEESLPTRYQFSAANLHQAADCGKLGKFMILHSMYYITVMKLNRHVPHIDLSIQQIAHHVSTAQQHAETFLRIIDAHAARRTPLPTPSSSRDLSIPLNNSSSPVVGYCIVSAIDILTAKVAPITLSSRLKSLAGAQTILAELAQSWQSARNQQAIVLQRIHDLDQIPRQVEDQGGAGAIGFQQENRAVGEFRDGVFEMREPLEKTFSGDNDVIYTKRHVTYWEH